MLLFNRLPKNCVKIGYIYSVTLKSVAALFHCLLKVGVFFDLLKQPFNGNDVFPKKNLMQIARFPKFTETYPHL